MQHYQYFKCWTDPSCSGSFDTDELVSGRTGRSVRHWGSHIWHTRSHLDLAPCSSCIEHASVETAPWCDLEFQ